jgi:hypothetical protein
MVLLAGMTSAIPGRQLLLRHTGGHACRSEVETECGQDVRIRIQCVHTSRQLAAAMSGKSGESEAFYVSAL